MVLKKRKDMDNQERIAQIVKRLKENEKYRSFWFKSDFMYFVYFIFFVCYLTVEEALFDRDIRVGVLSIVICFLVVGLCIFLVKRKDKKIMTQYDYIKAKINIAEVNITPPSRRYRVMAKYYFVAYYVKNEKTYRYQCIIRDEQLDLYHVMLRLLEDGSIPLIEVLINPHNQKRYKVLGYKFIEEILKLNSEIVCEELDEYYNTSIKWKYIKLSKSNE